MRLVLTIFVAAMSAYPASGVAQGLGEEVFREGEWRVYRSVDSFTDAVSCTGTFGDNLNIQLAPDALYVSLRGRGSVSSVTLRYGDEAPEPLRLASDIEKDIDTVIIQGEEFARVINADRLRVQVLTILSTLVFEDIGLDGFLSARELIREGEMCQ